MAAIELTRIEHQTDAGMPYQHVHIHLAAEDGLIEPGDLKGLEIPEGIRWSQGVVIEGKAPIWLYGYLVHQCHAAAWVGCFDPRLGEGGGAVVVATHTRQVKLGDVLSLRLPL